MVLIKCPECGKEISDKAISCPNCGLPLRREDRGTYNIHIKREKQWFLINPLVNIQVDSSEDYKLKSGEEITIPATIGMHNILFSLGPRKTMANIEIKEDMEIIVRLNGGSSELEVSGYGITTTNNSPTVSVGVSIGGIIDK